MLDDLLAAGFTSVASPGFNVPALLARWAASRRGQPRIRQFFYLTRDELGALPARPDRANPFFRIQGVKLWHDGSPYTGSMFLDAPYLDSALARSLGIPSGSRGEPMLAPADLDAEIAQRERAGWQVAVHSQGDASNREVVAAFARAPALAAGAPPRRIEHCVLLPEALLDELVRVGASPSFHIDHLFYYGDALADSIVGAERAARLLPVRAAFEHGLAPTLHADSPMFPAAPFHLMRTAVLRTTRSGRVLGAEQVDHGRAGAARVTIHGARQLGVERELGSLEAGKWADLVVAERGSPRRRARSAGRDRGARGVGGRPPPAPFRAMSDATAPDRRPRLRDRIDSAAGRRDARPLRRVDRRDRHHAVSRAGGGAARAVVGQARGALDADRLGQVAGRARPALQGALRGAALVLHRADQGAREREVLRALRRVRRPRTSAC